MLVGGVVIDNQVHVKGLGHTAIDMAQKIEELLVTMTTPFSPRCLRIDSQTKVFHVVRCI
jgi:hypothetical protein